MVKTTLHYLNSNLSVGSNPTTRISKLSLCFYIFENQSELHPENAENPLQS